MKSRIEMFEKGKVIGRGGFAAIIIVVTIITREGLSEEDVKVAVAMEGGCRGRADR